MSSLVFTWSRKMSALGETPLLMSNRMQPLWGFPYLEASYLLSASPNRTLPAIGSLMCPLFGWLKASNMCTDHSLWYIRLSSRVVLNERRSVGGRGSGYVSPLMRAFTGSQLLSNAP